MGKIEKIQRFVEKGKVDKLAAITHENDKEIEWQPLMVWES